MLQLYCQQTLVNKLTLRKGNEATIEKERKRKRKEGRKKERWSERETEKRVFGEESAEKRIDKRLCVFPLARLRVAWSLLFESTGNIVSSTAATAAAAVSSTL